MKKTDLKSLLERIIYRLDNNGRALETGLDNPQTARVYNDTKARREAYAAVLDALNGDAAILYTEIL